MVARARLHASKPDGLTIAVTFAPHVDNICNANMPRLPRYGRPVCRKLRSKVETPRHRLAPFPGDHAALQSEMTAPLCLQTCGLPQPRSTCLHVGTVRGHHSTSSDWLGLFAAILGRASPGCRTFFSRASSFTAVLSTVGALSICVDKVVRQIGTTLIKACLPST